MSEYSNAAEIATVFSRIIREWLSPVEVAAMNGRNAAETDGSICHSHDFCDANAAMLEAFEQVMGYGWAGDNDEDDDLVRDAWDRAKATGFATHESAMADLDAAQPRISPARAEECLEGEHSVYTAEVAVDTNRVVWTCDTCGATTGDTLIDDSDDSMYAYPIWH